MPTDLDDQILNPSYFDETHDESQPFSSGSSSMPDSSHSSTETAHSNLLEADSIGGMTTEMAYNLLSNEAPMSEEPLDFSKWADMSFPPTFDPNVQLPPAPQVQLDSLISGHHASASTSESERTRSSGTGESRVSTPVDGLGLHYIDQTAEGAAGGPSGQPMDFRW